VEVGDQDAKDVARAPLREAEVGDRVYWRGEGTLLIIRLVSGKVQK